jgi:hypothetical protein
MRSLLLVPSDAACSNAVAGRFSLCFFPKEEYRLTGAVPTFCGLLSDKPFRSNSPHLLAIGVTPRLFPL